MLSADERIEQLEARLHTVTKERDALRAKMAEMERQGPVGKFIRHPSNGLWEQDGYGDNPDARPLYALPGAQPAPSFADAYQGAMEEVAIWKKRALEAEDLNRKFLAEINGPMLMGEPVAKPAPSVPDDGFKRGVECAVALVARKAELYAIRFGDDDARRRVLSVLVDELCGLFKVQPAPSVPDGWKLVPIEPTPGMIDAAEYVDWGDADVRGSCINAWNRMLSVAPEAKHDAP